MQPLIVTLSSMKRPVAKSPGFAKKMLSEWKLDIYGLCQFGCAYCSTNDGWQHRVHREQFAQAAEAQLGHAHRPADTPALMQFWPDVLERLDAQLRRVRPDFGEDQTLVFSMLTDGFAPHLVRSGLTRRALDLLLARTAFRIRILTKSVFPARDEWIRFFEAHRDRFVIGMSIGTLDDAWARQVERLTPPPTSRVRALRKLQDAGLATYGMLCPVFPHMLAYGAVETLVDAIRPQHLEHIWAEPYNDRKNWRWVSEALSESHPDRSALVGMFGNHDRDAWSHYATDLFVRLRQKAIAGGWLNKLRYLLYERTITPADAIRYSDLQGVLLQGKSDTSGLSRNPAFAALQRARGATHVVSRPTRRSSAGASRSR